MKSIETKWKGWRFRSRTEARWAVFLEAIGVSFDYEPEGVILSSGPYLPDFRFDLHCAIMLESGPMEFTRTFWLEVKGQTPTPEELSKCREMARSLGNDFLLAVGVPDARAKIYLCSGSAQHPEFDDLFLKYDGLAMFATCSRSGELCLSFPDARDIPIPGTDQFGIATTCARLGYPRRPDSCPDYRGAMDPVISPAMQRAYDAARSARFEFGETDQRWS